MNHLNRRDLLKAAALAAGVAGAGGIQLAAGEGDGNFAGYFLKSWEAKRVHAIGVAEAMPADKYGFKPTEEMRSFGELMAHIAGSTAFFAALAVGEKPGENAKAPEDPTRDAILPFMQEAFEFGAAKAAGLSAEKGAEEITIFGELTITRYGVLEFMRDHVTHHLGYAIPYLRAVGVTEIPAYAFTGAGPSPM